MRRITCALLILAAYTSLPALADGPLPVEPALDQVTLLKSADAVSAKNKKLVYDFYRIVLTGHRLDQTARFMRGDYIQHNPNVDTGMAGFLQYFSKLGGPRPIPKTLPGLVAIQAEGSFVTLSFVDGGGATTWFDMFRIEDGKIAEHWDCAQKQVQATTTSSCR